MATVDRRDGGRAPAFGEALAACRAVNGLSQGDVATAAGAAKQTVSNWETGTFDPRWKTGVRLIDKLGLPLEEFIPPRLVLEAARRLGAAAERYAGEFDDLGAVLEAGGRLREAARRLRGASARGAGPAAAGGGGGKKFPGS